MKSESLRVIHDSPDTATQIEPAAVSLDPSDWPARRAQAHRMLDDMLDHVQSVRDHPLWQPIPQALRARMRAPLPQEPSDLRRVHDQFMSEIEPYGGGNTHPGFMGWVQGGGTDVGMLAEMLAGGLNANLGGRDHMAIEVERQVVHWMKALFGFPDAASGLFVTGASMANFMAVLIARTRLLGPEVRTRGVRMAPELTAYASSAAHGCIPQAMEMSGLGGEALRRIGVDDRQRIDLPALREAIEADRAAGRRPFLLIGTAGTVDTGAIDDLTGLARIAAEFDLWFHIDGALAALGMLSPQLAPRLAGIERADSIAFDFHKWGQAPYDAGFLLVRDGTAHEATFAAPAAYLQRNAGGLAGGDWWPCDFGPDLSRGFRALKVWFTIKTYGAAALGRMMAGTCALAEALARRVREEPSLELMAPVALNIVCFRYRCADASAVNTAIVTKLHMAGQVAPSLTVLGGQTVIRAAIVNHRTEIDDIERLVESVIAMGAAATGAHVG